jgi:hypothetical protein
MPRSSVNLASIKVGAFIAQLQGRPGKGSAALFPPRPVTFVNRLLELVMLRHNPAFFYPR